MTFRFGEVRWALLVALLCLLPCDSLAGTCEMSILQGGTRYNYSLASPIPNHPHGILSEDGFYKVAVNDTLLWFQLCTNMIFNHDPPRCFDCKECGGPRSCGTRCSALVSNDLGGYPVCTSIGTPLNQDIALVDKRDPNKGVIVKMLLYGQKDNCSLSVSIFCDHNGVQGPGALETLGTCNYATMLRHPSGCPIVISGNGKGSWIGTLVLVLLCLLGAYLLAGVAYRFYFLGIRGLDVIPNMNFWISLPQRAQSFLGSLLRRLRGQTRGDQSYAPIN